jgi:hypothetical protein
MEFEDTFIWFEFQAGGMSELGFLGLVGNEV